MKAIPQGLNIGLMHDFGADSLGHDHLYTADVLCKHAYWPILCTILGPVDKRLK